MNPEIRMRPHHFAKEVLFTLKGYTPDHTLAIRLYLNGIKRLPPTTPLVFAINTENPICYSCPKNFPAVKPLEKYLEEGMAGDSLPCFPESLARYDSVILRSIENAFEKRMSFTIADLIIALPSEKEKILRDGFLEAVR